MSEDLATEALLEFLNAAEAGIAAAKQRIKEGKKLEGPRAQSAAAAKEETFNILKFEPQEGAKIGAYDVGYKGNNVEEKWNQAFNILRQANATIKARYHGEGYVYSYWLFGEKNNIYRQKLKRA
jgi:hypothetical protein